MATGNPEQTQILIDGIDIANYLITWEQDCNNDNSTIKVINVTASRNLLDLFNLTSLTGKSIQISRGASSPTEYLEIDGEITSCPISGGKINLVAADKLYTTTRRKINRYFSAETDVENGVYSEIFKSIVNTSTNLLADDSSVYNTGTIKTISKFVCRGAVVFERLKTIADTLGYQLYFNNHTGKVHLEPKGYLNQATVFETGVNVVQIPKWTPDSTNLYNSITLYGQKQEIQTSETGTIGTTADYTTTSIGLDHVPLTVKVTYDGTLKTAGVPGTTSIYDYSIDSELKLIKWNTDQFTPVAGKVVQVDYTFLRPIIVQVQDDASVIANSPTGNPQPKEQVLTKSDITTYQDAENYALQYLADHKDPVLKTTIKVNNVKDLQVGQKVRVIDHYNNIDQFFTVVRIKKKYPYRFDEVDIVSRFIDENLYDWNIQQRIKRLEEQQLGDDDIVSDVKSISEPITITEMFEIEVNGSTYLKRDFRYYTYDDLVAGTMSDNVDIVNGDIRLL